MVSNNAFFDAIEETEDEFDYEFDSQSLVEESDYTMPLESEEEEEEEEEEDNEGTYNAVDTQLSDRKYKNLPMVLKSSLEFKAHTTRELSEIMISQSKHLEEIFQIKRDQAITLLQFFGWNSEKLMDEYMANPMDVQQRAGLKMEKSSSNKKQYPNDGFECPICCDDTSESYVLSCEHEFCITCYKRYISDRITGGNVIKCPNCDLALTMADIDIISGEGQSSKLLDSSIKEYVERHQTYKWCPSPDCDVIIEALNVSELPSLIKNNKIPVATCKYGHQFCFICSLENHTPIPCNASKRWITKCKDDSETINWIISNTKECPKCQTSIEKNGGCNHMTCKKCRYEFCWICMGEWKAHGNQFYQCNRYMEKPAEKSIKTNQESARNSLNRYMHYYNFYAIHDQSTAQDTKRCMIVEDLVRGLQEASGISWIEAQFLAESASSLSRGRRVLKWSYAFAFYCDRSNKPNGSFMDIYESVQANLTDSVEGLSKLFEIEDPMEIVKSKREFLNKQRFLIDRQNAMISCVNEALDKGLLALDID